MAVLGRERSAGGRRPGVRALAVTVGALLLVPLAVRPSPAAAAPAGDPPPSLLPLVLVGDSLAHQARGEIQEMVEAGGRPIGAIRTDNGAVVADVRDDTVALVEGQAQPPIVVLILGTAQAHERYWPFKSKQTVGQQWEADLRDLLGAVSPSATCVRIFDIQERDTGFYIGVDRHAEQMNRITRRVVGEFANTDYYHYDAWKDLTGPEVDLGDGLHHNLKGRYAVGRLVRAAANGCDPATAGAPFWDVRSGDYGAEAIAWMGAEGLAAGYDNGSYRSRIDRFWISIDRGETINMLWRLVGQPPASTAHPWSDGEGWIRGALDWAWEQGVASGFPNGTFGPHRTITRGQFANMLWELTGSPPATAAVPWSDVPPWLEPSLQWIAEKGLMDGYDNGTFRADRPITRAQMADLLYGWDGVYGT